MVIFPFGQAVCSTSRRTTRCTASRPKITLPARACRGRQPRPRRRPQRRGERRQRWGCDARASPGSGRVGRRGRCNPHRAGGPGGGRRRSCAIANPGLADDAPRRGPGPGGVGHAPSKTSRLQPAPRLRDSKTSSPLQDFETPRLQARSKTSIQDFETSARSSHRPSSPVLESILTLQSFMIPYQELCDFPADIAGGWVMISWALSWPSSWPSSCLIS